MGGPVGKASSRFHLGPCKPEGHVALLQGHLAWPGLGTVAGSAGQAGGPDSLPWATSPALLPQRWRGGRTGDSRWKSRALSWLLRKPKPE